MSAPTLKIQLFGPLRVLVHGELMKRPRGRTTEWLLALLVLRNDRPLDRAWLAGTLWPDSEESTALHNLRDALVHLRKAFGPERERLVSPTRDTLVLDLKGVDVDVLLFDRAIQAGDEESRREAVELNVAPLLEGCFEEWVHPERAYREQACLLAMETLAESAEGRGEYAEALSLLRRAESRDALRDSTQRSLMRVLAATGNAPAALHQFRQYRSRLRDEMNVAPDEETVQLYRQIRDRPQQFSTVRAAADQKPLAATPSPIIISAPPQMPSAASLPHPLTSLLGKDEEKREVIEAFSRARLLSLTGGGGVGKTRLAIEVARDVATATGEDAAFVALALVSDTAGLPAFVADTLGVRVEGSSGPEFQWQTLTNWLSTKRALLVLDNCEHLTAAIATMVQRLLERCPGLRILTTSRQRLGINGEIVWRVRPLAVPDASEGTSAILSAPAIQLLQERAAMAHPGFHLTSPHGAETAARICRRLEGIPLAIELAAARVGALDLDGVEARLDDRFRLLKSGSAAALPRHQTLRALIDWSYDLLSEGEKLLLRRLSVFQGGWTLEAAEFILDQREPFPLSDRDAPDALDVLSSLVDKSLVQREQSDAGARYHMLETIRDYALDKLRQEDEETAARENHLLWSMNITDREARHLFGPHPEPALNRLKFEAENLRAAVAFARSGPAPEGSLLRLAASMWPFWDLRGYVAEGREALREAIESPTSDAPQLRAMALLGSAVLSSEHREYGPSAAYAHESLKLFQLAEDDAGAAAALLQLGYVSLVVADVAGARSYLVEAIEYCGRAGWLHGTGVAWILMALADLAIDDGRSAQCLEEARKMLQRADDSCTPSYVSHYLGITDRLSHLAAARTVLSECVNIARRAGERRGIAHTLRALGQAAGRQGESRFALACFQEAAEVYRGAGSIWQEAFSLLDIGNWHYRAGDFASAAAAYTSSMESFRTLGIPVGLDTACNNLGSTLFHLGELERARLLHREALSHYLKLDNQEGMAWSLERLAVTEAHLGQPSVAAILFGAAEGLRRESGQAMAPWDQADWDQATAVSREAMADARQFDTSWRRGSEMTAEESVAIAMGGV